MAKNPYEKSFSSIENEKQRADQLFSVILPLTSNTISYVTYFLDFSKYYIDRYVKCAYNHFQNVVHH